MALFNGKKLSSWQACLDLANWSHACPQRRREWPRKMAKNFAALLFQNRRRVAPRAQNMHTGLLRTGRRRLLTATKRLQDHNRAYPPQMPQRGPSGGHPWRRIYFLVKQTGRRRFCCGWCGRGRAKGGHAPHARRDGTHDEHRRIFSIEVDWRDAGVSVYRLAR